jgi:hypothetical protein
MTALTQQCKFAVYVAGPSSPGFLGDVVLVAAASRVAGGKLFGEGYALIERPKAHLRYTEILFNEEAAPKDIGIPLELDAVLATALHYAERRVNGALNEEFERAKDLNLYRTKYSFVSVDQFHLALLWMSGAWHVECQAMRNRSHCDTLREWLTVVSTVPAVAVTGSG